MEDIAEAFIYRDKSIKNLKKNVKFNWHTYGISDFHLFNSSGKTELLESGLVTNEQKKNPWGIILIGIN